MLLSGRRMSEHGSYKSRHDFMQNQLMVCLILRAYMKTTYCSFVELLAGHHGLLTVLGMEGRLPHSPAARKSGKKERHKAGQVLIVYSYY